jgi:hypothetical protein
MIDTFTTNVTAAAHFARTGGMSEDVPSMADLMDESDPFAGMTPGPLSCVAHFHGRSPAYTLHVESGCVNPWS